MELRDVLKTMRTELGLSQIELANAMHVNYVTVNRWEAGKTYPNQSIMAALIQFASISGLSKDCTDMLIAAINKTKCAKIAKSKDKRYTVEHSSISQLIDDASYPIYVCDMETDDLLYINHTCEKLLGSTLEQLSLRRELAGDAIAVAYYNLTHNTVSDVVSSNAEYEKLVLSHPLDDILGWLRKAVFHDEDLIELESVGSHIQEVIKEQKTAGDNVAGVEAYLRKYCADEDVERVIMGTSLPYVKRQLEESAYYYIIYSLRVNNKTVYKRTLCCYLDGRCKTILCAIQDLTDLHAIENAKRNQMAKALQTLQEQAGMNVAPAYIDQYRGYFEKLRLGEAGTMSFQCRVRDGSLHWLRIGAYILRDSDGEPYQALLAFKDVGDGMEQTTVYPKWRQEHDRKRLDDYAMYRCNLNKDTSFTKAEGTLLRIKFTPEAKTINDRTKEYAVHFVHLDDFDAYTKLLNSENLLATYYRGTRMATPDYRERVSADSYQWLCDSRNGAIPGFAGH